MARVAVAALWAASAAGCDKVPLTAPSESTITLSSATLVLPVRGSTELTAIVVEKPGTIVQNGTVVTFTCTLGTVEPREARTKDGRVTALFRAGDLSGEAAINVSSGGAKLSEPLTIKIGGAAAGRVALSASPTSVPATGGTSQLVALVLDENGNTLPGVPVTFTATAGALGAAAVVTGSGGDARNTIHTDRETTVTATAGAQSAEVRVTAMPAPTAAISVSTANPIAGQSTVFQVSASSATGGSPVKEVSVSFGDGLSADLGALSSTATVSHVYRSSGTFTVTVTAIDMAGLSTQVSTLVTVAVAAPLAVTVSGSLTPTAGIAATYTASVTMTGGGTLPAIARYEWDFGDYSGLVVTTGNQTSHSFLSGGTKTVRVTVVAVDGTTGVGSIEVTVAATPTTPLGVTVSAGTLSPVVSTPVSFTASVSGATGGVARYEWSYGDGTAVQVTTGNQVSHVFAAAGTYTIRVTAVAVSGATGVGQTEVVVR